MEMMGEPASDHEISFDDVPQNAYYYEALQWAVEKGITTGLGNTNMFGPDNTCTRANAVTFIYRAMN